MTDGRVGRFDEGGVALQWRLWPGSGDWLVLVHHGLGEHCGRWEVLAKALEGLPVRVGSYDMRGHGLSGGAKGDALGMGQLADDLVAMIGVLMAESGATKLMLFGHSLGAGVVATALIHRQMPISLQAVVLSAPPVFVPRGLSVRAKIGVGRVLRLVAPGVRLTSEVDPNGLSHDEGEVARYASDPLVHDRVSVRLGLSIVDDGPKLVEGANRITWPSLVFVGSEDPVIAPEGVERFAAQVGSKDKTFQVLDGCRHEPHFERADLRAKWRDLVRGWVGQQVGAT